jgi:drug/metabolite transporter (DMT)-like permease
MTQKSSMGTSEWIMLATLSILWGGSFFFMKLSLAELPTLLIVFSRVAIAAIALFVFLNLSGIALPAGKQVWLAFFTMGFLNNLLPFSLLVWGMTEIASGLAAILNATTPVFTILVAHFMTSDERISINKLIGVLLGLAGVAVLIGFDALDGFNASILAMLACIGAALSYAFAAAYGRRFKEYGVQPTQVAFGQVTASSLLLFPVAIYIDSPWNLAMPGVNTWMALLALGIFSTALAYVLYFRILAAAGATNIALVTLLVPVSAILLGWLILGEVLSHNHFVGMGLITLGLLAIDGRLIRLFKSETVR